MVSSNWPIYIYLTSTRLCTEAYKRYNYSFPIADNVTKEDILYNFTTEDLLSQMKKISVAIFSFIQQYLLCIYYALGNKDPLMDKTDNNICHLQTLST